jgi:hypothetical protein
VLEGELAGDERGSSAVAVFEELEDIVTLGVGERREPEVVEDEELRSREAVEELGVGPVGAGDGELSQEPREAVEARRETVAAGAVAERAGDVALSGAGGTGDEHLLVVADPLASGEAEDEALVEPAGAAEVDVLGRRGKVELRHLQESGEAPVVAEGVLTLEEQGEPVLEREVTQIGHAHLLLEGVGHAGEA